MTSGDSEQEQGPARSFDHGFDITDRGAEDPILREKQQELPDDKEPGIREDTELLGGSILRPRPVWERLINERLLLSQRLEAVDKAIAIVEGCKDIDDLLKIMGDNRY